jgi:hypothetical protein
LTHGRWTGSRCDPAGLRSRHFKAWPDLMVVEPASSHSQPSPISSQLTQYVKEPPAPPLGCGLPAHGMSLNIHQIYKPVGKSQALFLFPSPFRGWGTGCSASRPPPPAGGGRHAKREDFIALLDGSPSVPPLPGDELCRRPVPFCVRVAPPPIHPRVFPKTPGAIPPLLGGEGRGEDGRFTNCFPPPPRN